MMAEKRRRRLERHLGDTSRLITDSWVLQSIYLRTALAVPIWVKLVRLFCAHQTVPHFCVLSSSKNSKENESNRGGFFCLFAI